MIDLQGPLQEARIRLFPVLERWNTSLFLLRKACATLCGEEPMNKEVPRSFAVYLLDSTISTENDEVVVGLGGRNGIQRVDVIEPVIAEFSQHEPVFTDREFAFEVLGLRT